MNARLPDADEEMLAAADALVGTLAGEIHGGVLGDANIAACQRLSGQGITQLRCGVEYGVTFGHRYSTILRETSHSRRALSASTASRATPPVPGAPRRSPIRASAQSSK